MTRIELLAMMAATVYSGRAGDVISAAKVADKLLQAVLDEDMDARRRRNEAEGGVAGRN